MARTNAIIRSFHMLTKKRLTLQAMQRRLDAEERKVMEAMSRMLAASGYRVVALDGNTAESGRTRRPRRRLANKRPIAAIT